MKRTIRQLIPATGWSAVYKDSDGIEWRDPLVAWALVKTEYEANEELPRSAPAEYEHVLGMDTREGLVDFCESSGNFVEYVYEGNDSLGSTEGDHSGMRDRPTSVSEP